MVKMVDLYHILRIIMTMLTCSLPTGKECNIAFPCSCEPKGSVTQLLQCLLRSHWAESLFVLIVSRMWSFQIVAPHSVSSRMLEVGLLNASSCFLMLLRRHFCIIILCNPEDL